MDCPVCKTTQLVLAERQGIEIDYCPNCRGIWLDRGEIDKMVEHFARMKAFHTAKSREENREWEERRRDDDRDDRDRDGRDDRKRDGEGFLEGLKDIFD